MKPKEKSEIRKATLPLLKGIVKEIKGENLETRKFILKAIEAVNRPVIPELVKTEGHITNFPDTQKVTGSVEVDFPEVQKVEVTNPTKMPEISIEKVEFPEVQKIEGEVQTPTLEKKMDLLAQLLKEKEPFKLPNIVPVRITNQQFAGSAGASVFPFVTDTGKPVQATLGDKGQLTVSSIGYVDPTNSTETVLASGGSFVGQPMDVTDFGIVFINVYSDVASATDGLVIEQSSNGEDWDHDDKFSIPAATGKNFSINPYAKFLRVRYVNSDLAQSEFRLQTIFKENSKPSSHRIQDPIIDDDDAELVKAVLTGKANGEFKNVNTTPDGDLKISDNSSGLSIAQGNVTGTSFIHKFGEAPDFDSGDGEVTIWDGADDGLFSGSPPMKYTYSSTADIGLISSSSASDTGDIEIQGLDSDFNLVTQTITLNGQTDVDISAVGGTDLIRVFRMKNVGTSDFVGVIYLRTNGSGQSGGVPSTANTVRAIVNGGNNQTLMAVYTIPAGKTGYMRDWYAATSGGNKDSNYKIRVYARPFGQVFQLKHTSAIAEGGSSHIQHRYEEPEVLTEKTDIYMSAATTESPITAANVSGGFDIVLVDN